MIQAAAKVICVLAGLLCLLALADRWGWLAPFWGRVLPEVVLPRFLTARETQMAQLAKQIEAAEEEIATLEEAKSDSQGKRCDLLRQLRRRLRQSNSYSDDATRLAKGDPVAAVLVWFVDAEDRRLADIKAQIERTQAELNRLQSRLIALRNGVSQVELAELTRPSEQLPGQGGGQTAIDRFRRIVREAMELTN